MASSSSNEPYPRGTLAPLREPDVPDPFLHDSDEEEEEEEEDESSEQPDGPSPLPATQEISISSPPPRSPAPPLPATIDLNKDVPPPPVPSDTEDDDETDDDTEDLYLPALVQPTLFLPIPNVSSSELVVFGFPQLKDRQIPSAPYSRNTSRRNLVHSGTSLGTGNARTSLRSSSHIPGVPSLAWPATVS